MPSTGGAFASLGRWTLACAWLSERICVARPAYYCQPTGVWHSL